MSGLSNPRDFARRLLDIASKVACLPPPSATRPEAFHIDRSERASDLRHMAYEIAPDLRQVNGTHPRPPLPPAGLPVSPRRKPPESGPR